MSSTPKKRNLGRGLDVLLGSNTDRSTPSAKSDGPPAVPRDQASRSDGLTPNSIQIGQIRPGKYQPRRKFDEEELESLANSIRDKGVLQPILVRPHSKETGAYELIAGERRWLAAQRAKLREIPALVKKLTDKEALEIAIVENVQRQDLSPMEEAEGYLRLMDEFKHTQEDISNAIGKSRSHVANMLRLNGLPTEIKSLVNEGTLTAGHARALIGVPSAESLANRIVKGGLSVRDAEKLARQASVEGGTKKKPSRTRASVAGKDPDTIALEHSMTEKLGLKVEINAKKEAGDVVISYKNLEQLDDLLQKLMKE